MSNILENIIDSKLNLILESIEAIDPHAPGYDRQRAEDLLWHTVGPLTDDPKWLNSKWSSSTPEPEDYEPGGPAYKWTPEQVVYAFAGNPSKLFMRSPDSPNSGKMGGSPMFRLAKRVARKFGKSQDDDFIADVFSNGFVPLTKMMHKGFDEGREPFISYVMRSVQGAMESGPGADKASLEVTSGDRSKNHFGLAAALDSRDPKKIRTAADKVKGEYRTKKSYDKHPDNPYQAYSYSYYTTMHNYADALESGSEDRIEAAQNQIRQLIDDIESSNPVIRGAASGMSQAVSNMDRGAASGEARYLVKTRELEKIANSDKPDTFKKLTERLELIKQMIGLLNDKIAKAEDQDKKELFTEYKHAMQSFVKAVLGNDQKNLKIYRDKLNEYIQKHKDEKKFGVASMDYKSDDDSDSMGSSLTGDDNQDNWLDPEAVQYILDIALNYDVSQVLSKNSKWLEIAKQNAKGGKISGKMNVRELRYIIRSMGPLGSNYPGKDVVRSSTSVPRDTEGWWKPGEDPEIEPIRSLGLWNSIWKRNGYNPMTPSEIANEMASEVMEFKKLGISTGRTLKKTESKGKTEYSVMSKVAVSNDLRSAKVKLQIIADIHKDDIGIGEGVKWINKDKTDRMIISECAQRMANKLNKSLILEAASSIYRNLIV